VDPDPGFQNKEIYADPDPQPCFTNGLQTADAKISFIVNTSEENKTNLNLKNYENKKIVCIFLNIQLVEDYCSFKTNNYGQHFIFTNI
jgi:hypothetical protein